MSELIDRQALLEQYDGNLCTTQTDYAQGCRDIIEDIKNAPTVEERKHGHWNYSNIAKQGFKCSVCNRSSKNGSPFCQWCGAIMNEVSEDE